MKNILYLSIGFFIGVCSFVFVNSVFANVLYTQSDYANYFITNAPNSYWQYLPAGSTGTIGSIKVRLDDVVGGSDPVTMTVQTLTGAEGSRSCDDMWIISTNGTSVAYQTLDHEGEYVFDFIDSYLNTSCAYNVPASTQISGGIVLNPAKLYVFQLYAGQNKAFRWYGSTSDNFAGAKCANYNDSACPSSIKDVYFVIYDDFGTVENGQTRIDKVYPLVDSNNSTSTSFLFGVDGYVSTDDSEKELYVRQQVQLRAAGVNCPTIYNVWGDAFEWDIGTDQGSFGYSTTTDIQQCGVYGMITTIRKDNFGIWDLGYLSSDIDQVVSIFTVGDVEDYEVENVINDTLIGWNESASTTLSYSASSCNWNAFVLEDCVKALFLPKPQDFRYSFDLLKNGMLSYWPLGYITDFATILSTTSEMTAIGISAIVPSGIPGTGSEINLSLSSTTLSYIYDATVGSFVNSSAPDTRSFYDITNDYWEIIVYLLLGIYLISRVISSVFVPDYNPVGEYKGRKLAFGKSKRDRNIRLSNAKRLYKKDKEFKGYVN